jgi:phosphoribosylaminoimidazolecarboxamide formyltransferase/IMP cyclohydrolase
MAKDFKTAYKTIMDDHFTPGLELSFINGDRKRTLVYKKVSWLIHGGVVA